MNDKLYRLLLEYLKDSSRSDRELAKILGVSQPTISRMRAKLLKDGVIHHFSACPDFAKMGYEILAFSLVKFNMSEVLKDYSAVVKKARCWVDSCSEIVFDSRAEGMGVDVVSVSLHRSYAEYKKFLTKSKKVWGNLLIEINFVLVDVKGGINKPFSFKYLARPKNEVN
jgi:DNA-binding Lrp family transcriptional regulator